MGLLSPEGGANIGQAISTYSETKGESNGLIDLISDQFGVPKTMVEQFVKQVKKKGKKSPSSKKEEK